MRSTHRSTSAKPAGRGCATIFGGIFALMGLLFFVLVAKSFIERLTPYFWTQTPCTILESRAVELKEQGDYGNRHEFQVRYRYVFKGQNHEGTRARMSSAKFDKPSEARRLQHSYREGQPSVCFVKSSDPRQSVLERESLWFGFVLLFPLVFVAVGVFVIVAGWRTKPEAEVALSERHAKARARNPVWAYRIFGALFFLIGCAVTYGLSLRPWQQVRAAADWPEVPCTILSSKVSTHSGSKGATYSLDVRYEYFVEGEKRLGDRYNFSPGTSSSIEWRQRARAAYPKGLQTVCYVNPADPDEAVLVRELGPDKWFGLIPLVFVIIGLAIMLGAPRMARKQATTVTGLPASTTGLPAGEEAAPASLTAPAGMVALASSGSRVGKFAGLAFATLFWNGIVWGVFLLAKPPFFVKLFLTIFIVIGVGIAFGAIVALLAIFNPKPSLFSTGRRVSLGGSIDLQFRFSGNVRRLQRLRLVLRGQESATYQRGTNTTTDKHTFLEIPLLDSTDRTAMAQGSVRVEIPADSMHTFEATNNQILWSIHLRGDIGWWPKVEAEYPIVVLPLPTTHHS